MRRFLDGIAQFEGVKHGYNTIFGNERFNDLSKHPNVRKEFRQTDGLSNVTTAAGRYQFLKPTWDEQARRYGLKDFSPQSQDIAAIGLIIQNGSLPYILKGDYQTAAKRSGGTWASLPSSPYAQPRRSQSEVDRFFGGNSTASYEPEIVPKNLMQKTMQSYEPEIVPMDMMTGEVSTYEPEIVPLNNMTGGDSYEPEIVPKNMLASQEY